MWKGSPPRAPAGATPRHSSRPAKPHAPRAAHPTQHTPRRLAPPTPTPKPPTPPPPQYVVKAVLLYPNSVTVPLMTNFGAPPQPLGMLHVRLHK
jgi:hypothetical protein